jgi:hypothetical protein
MKNLKTLPKIHLACPCGDLEFIMNYILVTKKDIVANDGRILAIHKTEEIFNEDFIEQMPERFLIHYKIWREMCKKHCFIDFEKGMIKVKYSCHTAFYPIELEANINNYPAYQIIFPKDIKEVNKIGINSSLLKKLSIVMGTSNLKLIFYGENKGIIAEGKNSDYNAKGLIMPLMIND